MDARSFKLQNCAEAVCEVVDRARAAHRKKRGSESWGAPVPREVCMCIATFLFEPGSFGRLESLLVIPTPMRAATIDRHAPLRNTQPRALHFDASGSVATTGTVAWVLDLEDSVRHVGVSQEGLMFVLSASFTVAVFNADLELLRTWPLLWPEVGSHGSAASQCTAASPNALEWWCGADHHLQFLLHPRVLSGRAFIRRWS